MICHKTQTTKKPINSHILFTRPIFYLSRGVHMDHTRILNLHNRKKNIWKSECLITLLVWKWRQWVLFNVNIFCLIGKKGENSYRLKNHWSPLTFCLHLNKIDRHMLYIKLYIIIYIYIYIYILACVCVCVCVCESVRVWNFEKIKHLTLI